MHSAFDHIRDLGFESSLDHLIAYAEMQARLYQSLNDRDQHLFWVRSWAQLQRASDAIAFPTDDQVCLEMWRDHCSEYAKANIDFNFSNEKAA